MIWFDKEDRRQVKEQIGRIFSVLLILALVLLTVSKFIPKSFIAWARDEIWTHIVWR